MNNSLSITVVITLLTAVTSVYAFSNPELQARWMMNPFAVSRRKEYYRMLSSGLIHQDWMHLLFNMLAFYLFGERVEYLYKMIFGPQLGGLAFLGLYVLGVVISDLPTYFKYRDYPHYNSLGASGGVSAVVFASILFTPTQPICLYAILCLPGFVFAVLYILYSVQMSRQGGDNINHDAHLYGAIFGAVFTIVLYPPVVLMFIRALAEWRIF
ncbi:rhomboid family intramembrane serine protease [Eisenibacter elegans]|jgi:membrane associated rhomboid family serine protease|uniref:rhomboid family intramembrane serine protease n=1 Tax=Eisenibacter elegans TaxID=997 RepID=UPI0004100CD9|nr:rhomboid family intramembrane serine protease [Eisenibacter elegans]